MGDALFVEPVVDCSFPVGQAEMSVVGDGSHAAAHAFCAVAEYARCCERSMPAAEHLVDCRAIWPVPDEAKEGKELLRRCASRVLIKERVARAPLPRDGAGDRVVLLHARDDLVWRQFDASGSFAGADFDEALWADHSGGGLVPSCVHSSCCRLIHRIEAQRAGGDGPRTVRRRAARTAPARYWPPNGWRQRVVPYGRRVATHVMTCTRAGGDRYWRRQGNER